MFKKNNYASGLLLCFLIFTSFAFLRAKANDETKIVLLGDSTTIGSIERLVRPAGPHLEDVITTVINAEGDLPSCKVINLGQDGEYIQRLIESGRYDKEVATLQDVDYIFIRYGLNDIAKRENFAENFPKDLRDLITRLRKDHPNAVIIPMTLIAYLPQNEVSEQINAMVKQVAQEEGLAVFDIYPASLAERTKAPEMLHYRRYPLAQIPPAYQEFVKPFVFGEDVIVMDNELDATLGHLPGWYSDYHPNFAGYQIIGNETAKYLIPLLRDKLPN